MDRSKFELLLTDLYDVYNPSKKSDIPFLLDKYNGQEFDAVFYMLMKHNYPKSSHYNPEIGTEKHVRYLIDKYTVGERVFKNPFADTKPKESELIEQTINSAKEELHITAKQTSDELTAKLEKIDDVFTKKMNELYKLIDLAKPKANINIEVKLNLLWSEQELKIPNEVEHMSIGERFLMTGESGKMLGFEVKDIFSDFVSKPGVWIKEITIDKV